MIKVSILSIGDELCIGQVLNTNAQWIAERCTEIGCRIIHHLTVSDDKQKLIDSLSFLNKLSDFIIITGGLGPTSDDITKPVLIEYFSDKLEKNDEIAKDIEEFYRKRNRAIPEISLNQAYLPMRAKPIRNLHGTAPGMIFHENGVYYISLPGVPYEMKEMMMDTVIPMIKDEIIRRNETIVKYKTLHTSGIFEANLAELIGNEKEFLDDGEMLAYLPSSKGVRLRIGATANSFQEAEERLQRIENILKAKIGVFLLPSENKDLNSYVGELLRAKKATLAVAESCTGGMLGAEITSISGASDYFIGGEITYSNWAKVHRLCVNEETLKKFGAVSEQTACEMAENVRKIFNANYGISITGIAGPTGGSQEKPVGTVWIGLSSSKGTYAKLFNFGNNRQINRERAVFSALNELKRLLIEDNN